MEFYESLDEMVEKETERLQTLSNFPETGIILAVYEQGDGGNNKTSFMNKEVEELQIDIKGIINDRHRRISHLRTGREKTLYPKGVNIKESRHWFAVSPHDVKLCSQQMGVEITAEMLGANFLIGAKNGKVYPLSKIPVGTYMLIAPPNAIEVPKPPLATLIVYARQLPCIFTGNPIANFYEDKYLASKFVEKTKENRGIVGTVQFPVTKPAAIRSGYKVFFKFPKGIES